MQNIINRPSLVLLIDCWEMWDKPKNSVVEECYTNIQNFCINNPYVHSIGLASYSEADSKHIAQEEPWHSNAKELFYSSTRWEQLRKSWDNTIFDQCPYTHPIIRNLRIRTDQTQFSIWNPDQLLYYCNYIYPIIENIYIFGLAWNICLESRPIGWKEIAQMNYYNLFSYPKTILSNTGCVADRNKNFLSVVAHPWEILYNDTIILNQSQINSN